MTTLRPRHRRTVAAPLAALALAAACAHTHHVAEGSPGDRESAAHEEQGASRRATPKRVPPRGDRPAVAASPEGLMNPGAAREIQEALRRHGYLHREPSGHLDEPTSAALRTFQRRQGLAETGAPDRETLRRLGVAPADVYKTAPGS